MNLMLTEISRKQKQYMRLTTDAARAIFESNFSATAEKRVAALDKRYVREVSSPVRKFRIRLEEEPDRVIAWAVAQRVREARERQGLRQEDLAAKAGIARPNIARLEKGVHIPTLATLQKIAVALNIDINVLTASPTATPDNRLRFEGMAEAGMDEWDKILDEEDSRK